MESAAELCFGGFWLNGASVAECWDEGKGLFFGRGPWMVLRNLKN